jgi:hypothetical protein
MIDLLYGIKIINDNYSTTLSVVPLIDGTIPSGYEKIVNLNELNKLKEIIQSSVTIIGKKYIDDWPNIESLRRSQLALDASQWAESISMSVIGYTRYVAYRIYRQNLRDVRLYPTATDIVWLPEPLTDEVAITLFAPRIVEENTKAWLDVLWSSCYDFKFDLISDDGLVKLNELANYGFPKSVAMKAWLDALWMNNYYPRRAALLAGEAVNFDFKTGNVPPYTVAEALAEAAAMMAANQQS